MSYIRQVGPWTRAMIGILALGAVAIAISVATASGADSRAKGDVTFAAGPDPDVIEKFQQCMSDHGIDVPEPGERFEGPPGVHEPSDEEREAFEACQDELPKPPEGAFTVPAPPPNDEAFQEFRDCMADEGADVPKPPERGEERPLHEPSAREEKALEACRVQLPAPRFGACPPPGPPPAPGMSQD